MKVNRTGYINSGSYSSHAEEHKPQQKEVARPPEGDASNSKCSFGKAAVNMQNPMGHGNAGDIFALLNSIAKERGYTVYRFFEKNQDGVCARAMAGDEIPGWKNLYNDRLSISCYKDKDNNTDEIYTLDSATKQVNVYDKNGEIIKTFTPEEMKALFEYKYHPEQIHGLLRNNRYHSMLSEENLWNLINTIDNCFNSPDKVYKTKNQTTVYRALQNNLSDSDKVLLSTVGAVYRDNSFVSTTQNLDTAKRFNTPGNPIMEISLPEGSKYLDLDRLLTSTDGTGMSRSFFLKRGSEFLITGYDKDKNIIKACYLNK